MGQNVSGMVSYFLNELKDVHQSSKLNPAQFVAYFYGFAKKSEKETGVPAIFTLAQSALETGWNKHSPGWMMFGIKDTDGVNGNEQLLQTTEYHNSPNYKYPVILAITEVIKGKRWKYSIKDWFRKYPTPFESFRDHGNFLKKNKRYANAFTKKDPFEFAKEICKAGYATDPNYQDKIIDLMNKIKQLLPG